MRYATVILCLCVLAGCARSAVDPGVVLLDAGSASTGNPNDPADAEVPGTDGNTPIDAKDSGGGPAQPDAGSPEPDAAPAAQCDNGTLSCETAMALGEVDASDSSSVLMRQGKGSGWFAVDLRDGNMGSTSTIRIGVSVKLTAPAGSSYAVTLMGDTGPDGGGRCIAADVTDTDPLDKTAIWGSFGPTAAQKRLLAVHVEHLSGPCDANWTLTVSGNPCPVLSIGSGENSMGSCP